MDLDTVSGKNSHQKILEQFEKEKYDILLGTQMVTKGLDFEKVTLVGVLAADMGLYTDDYRAGERTFDLLTQVCGRAGRGRYKGRAIIQTYAPENSVLQHAQTQNYTAFYKDEIALRHMLKYPPFSTLISIVFASKNESAAIICAKRISDYLRFNLKNESYAEILGPAACGVQKINNKYRKRILIKCQLNDTIMRVLTECQDLHYRAKENQFVNMAIEMNPTYTG